MSCTCKLTDGTSQVCVSVANEDCCIAIAAASSTATFEFTYRGQAGYCPAMCTYASPELGKYCSQEN